MDKKIKIYIVEDYFLARITFEQTLKQYDDIDVVGSFETAEECIEALAKKQVDVILMDIGLPSMNGIDATKKIREKNPNVKIIMLTSHDRREEIISSIASGANGYAIKDIEIDELHKVIKTINQGSLWIDSRIARVVQQVFNRNEQPTENVDFNLTEREREVLALLTQGLSNAEIAERIYISPHTAKAHVCSILAKLSVTDRVQAAVKAIKYNL